VRQLLGSLRDVAVDTAGRIEFVDRIDLVRGIDPFDPCGGGAHHGHRATACGALGLTVRRRI